MSPAELSAGLDAMLTASGGDPDAAPGLITIPSGAWCDALHELEHKTLTLADGVRHRNIKIVISSEVETRVLTRAEAGDRGEPYRDLVPFGRPAVPEGAAS